MRRVVLTVLDLLLVALKPSVQIDDGNITGRDPKGASIAGSSIFSLNNEPGGGSEATPPQGSPF